MTVFDFPAFGADFWPSSSDMVLVSNSKMDVSAVNNSQSISEFAGEYWQLTYHFGVLYPEHARLIKGHLMQLRGHINATRALDTSYSHLGNWDNYTLTVNGANQYGLALDIKGGPANQTIAYATDRFYTGSQVHELVEDAVTDAIGNCTLQLANEIREPATDDQPIVTDITGLLPTFRWADPNEIKQFKGRKRLYRDVTLTFMEAV